MRENKEPLGEQEIMALASTFKKAVFDNPDHGSIFVGYGTAGEQVRQAEENQDRENELKQDVDDFFALINNIVSKEKKGVKTAFWAVSILDATGSTWSRGSLEVSDRNQSPEVKKQIYIAETAPLSDPSAANVRIDKVKGGERERLLNEYANLSRFSTDGAASKRSEIIAKITDLSRTIIEFTDIQYQKVRGRDLDPRVGVRLARYLDGWQAFPIIYEGKNAIKVYDRPLFNTQQEVAFRDLNTTMSFNLIPRQDFRRNTLYRIKEALFSKVTSK